MLWNVFVFFVFAFSSFSFSSSLSCFVSFRSRSVPIIIGAQGAELRLTVLPSFRLANTRSRGASAVCGQCRCLLLYVHICSILYLLHTPHAMTFAMNRAFQALWHLLPCPRRYCFRTLSKCYDENPIGLLCQCLWSAHRVARPRSIPKSQTRSNAPVVRSSVRLFVLIESRSPRLSPSSLSDLDLIDVGSGLMHYLRFR